MRTVNHNNKKTTSQYTCGDYREEMILLALRQKLKWATLTQEEKAELEKEIARLEKEIGF
jgi:hypothetical protein